MRTIRSSLPLLLASLVIGGCATDNGTFSKVDVNNNNAVTYDEFDAYMKAEVFELVDENGDGKVSQAEWRAFSPKAPISVFKRVDANSDGFISRAEADADFDKEGSLKKLFVRIDTDGNGTLSKEEVAAFKAKMDAAKGDTELQKVSNAAAS